MTTHPDSAARQEVEEGLETYSQELFRVLSRKLPSDQAQDLLQEVCKRALQGARSYQCGTNIRAWLHRIACTTSINQYRSQQRHARVSLTEEMQEIFGGQTLSTEEILMQMQLSPRVSQAMASLPSSWQRLVWLIAVEEYSYKEAAQRLSLPLGTVCSRYARALEKLRASLSQSETPYASLSAIGRRASSAKKTA